MRGHADLSEVLGRALATGNNAELGLAGDERRSGLLAGRTGDPVVRARFVQ
jgi:hypothetical protein